MKYRKFILCTLAATFLTFTGCAASGTSDAEPPTTENTTADTATQEAERESVVITIKTPSDVENTIAAGRHVKICGTLEGEIPEDASLRVSVLDKDGNEVRYAQAYQKGTNHISTEAYKGDEIVVFSDSDTFEDVAYSAPEMVVKDVEHPEETFRDATVKCIYTDEKFYALIVSATDEEHGLVEDDQYNLLDENGEPYDALPEGNYMVSAVLTSPDGEILGSAERSFVIGKTKGTIIHEITNKTVIEKGGNDLLFAWTKENSFGLLYDLLPGFFGEHYQMSTLPMSVGAETAEYLQGPIEVLLYNNTETSTSYCLEMAKYLQVPHTIEDADVASFYVFDIGEPRVGEQTAKIESIGDEKVHICRIDQVDDEAEDGVFVTSEEQIVSSDLNARDGWTVLRDGSFAITGVVRPYQLKEDELVPSATVYGDYEYLNGPGTLTYTFTAKDQPDDVITVTKDMGIDRRDAVEEDPNHKSVYEFYHVFDSSSFRTNTDYEVCVQLSDRKGDPVADWFMAFEFSWE